MKASPFRYERAEAIEAALASLHAHGSEARLIAGGQSLVPMMAMRLSTPSVLIDINRLPILNDLQIGSDYLTTGATLRQADCLTRAPIRQHLPLLHTALPWVGHQQTRNRGTLGGSMAHADPSAEIPLVACVLDARIDVRGAGDSRRLLRADKFFDGPLQTTMQDTEMLCGVDWPLWQPSVNSRIFAVFDEIAIRRGDFAIASAACQIEVGADNTIARAAFGLGGVDAVPRAFPSLASELVGQRMSATLARDVAARASALCDPGTDIHATAQYRRHLATVLLARSLMQPFGLQPGAASNRGLKQ